MDDQTQQPAANPGTPDNQNQLFQHQLNRPVVPPAEPPAPQPVPEHQWYQSAPVEDQHQRNRSHQRGNTNIIISPCVINAKLN